MKNRDRLGRQQAVKSNENERLAALADRLGRAHGLRRTIIWPGGSAKIQLLVLSVVATRDAEYQAVLEVQTALGNPDLPVRDSTEILETAKAKHILARACLDPATGEPFFSGAVDLGETATEHELIAVYMEYMDLKSEVDPSLSELGEEKLALIDEALKKKDRTSLRTIASDLRRNSLLTLVELLCAVLMTVSCHSLRAL